MEIFYIFIYLYAVVSVSDSLSDIFITYCYFFNVAKNTFVLFISDLLLFSRCYYLTTYESFELARILYLYINVLFSLDIW